MMKAIVNATSMRKDALLQSELIHLPELVSDQFLLVGLLLVVFSYCVCAASHFRGLFCCLFGALPHTSHRFESDVSLLMYSILLVSLSWLKDRRFFAIECWLVVGDSRGMVASADADHKYINLCLDASSACFVAALWWVASADVDKLLPTQSHAVAALW